MPTPASIATALALCALPVPAAFAVVDGHAGLEGTYVVIDHRIAAGVAATTASYDPEARRQELDRTVAYGDTLIWYDGRFCDVWQAAPGGGPDPVAADPNLADLQLDVAGASANVPVALSCDGAPFAAIVRIDARVQIAFVPNGTMYVVLERVPSAAETSAIQQGLQDLGHYAGPVDGTMSPETRDAVAAFVASQGVARPSIGIVTEAVIQGLRVD